MKPRTMLISNAALLVISVAGIALYLYKRLSLGERPPLTAPVILSLVAVSAAMWIVYLTQTARKAKKSDKKEE